MSSSAEENGFFMFLFGLLVVAGLIMVGGNCSGKAQARDVFLDAFVNGDVKCSPSGLVCTVNGAIYTRTENGWGKGEQP